MNILMLLQMAADAHGDRIAVSCGEQTLTYTVLYQLACQAGERMRASGAHRVVWLGESSLATPVALFGAAAAALPYVPLNYRLTAGELEGLLDRVTPALMLTGAGAVEKTLERAGIEVCHADKLLAQHANTSELPEPAFCAPDDIAVQLFTSGTTGKPKAALLRHSHLVSYILNSVDFSSAATTESVLVTVPPYHIAGISALLSATYAGRRIVLLPSFDPGQWLKLARQERVSNAFLVPTMLTRIIELLESRGQSDAGLPDLRALAYGGGNMPLTVIERALDLLPEVDFTNAYGLTETSSTITLLGPEDHREAFASDDPQVRSRLTSAGRPLPGLEVEVRDTHGNTLPAGQSGEIYVRGEQVSGEYAEQGSLLDGAGWFPTRDAGLLDQSGYLHLGGRADDIIIRGGENISPGEIEDVLLTHPAIAEAAVVGVPSTQWGESIAAALVLRAGQEVTTAELQAYTRTHLRSSRTPESIRFVESLPHNEMGKMLRREIRGLFSPANQ
jgi:acyl-CoA synthetase (AMP-forming)/AMP-acid ligase II